MVVVNWDRSQGNRQEHKNMNTKAEKYYFIDTKSSFNIYGGETISIGDPLTVTKVCLKN